MSGKIRFLSKVFVACVVILSVVILLNGSASPFSSHDVKKEKKDLSHPSERIRPEPPTREQLENLEAKADSRGGIDASHSTGVSSNSLKDDEKRLKDDDTFAKKHGFRTYTPPPGWSTSQVPQRIRELAVNTVGEEKAKEFFLTVGCSKFVFQGKTLWMWHNKHDVPDWNPGYQWRYVQKTSIAIDVGANIGDTAVMVMTANPNLQVISFEPSPFTFIFACWNVLHNGFSLLSVSDLGSKKPGARVFWGGATNDGREIELMVSLWNTKHSSMISKGLGLDRDVPWGLWLDRDVPCTSRDCSTKTNRINQLFQLKKKGKTRTGREDSQHAARWSTMKAPSYSIPHLLRQHNISHVGWWKIDCEGCEYEILTQLEEGHWFQGAHVTGEAHFRGISNVSCYNTPKDPVCIALGKPLHRTRYTMCIKYKFPACAKVTSCSVFDSVCFPRVQGPRTEK